MATSQNLVPFIPDNAPFSPEQRAWLNGFLAGIYSGAAPGAAPAASVASLKIAVLYASQSGTAEGLARKLSKELKAKGHAVAMNSLEGYTPAALASERHAIVIASTYGEGDAPDTAQPFYEQLCMEAFPRFENLSYAICALGDSHYEHFCKFGTDLDAKLISLGATRITERVDCDVDLEMPYAGWKTALLARLESIATGGSAGAVPAKSNEEVAAYASTANGVSHLANGASHLSHLLVMPHSAPTHTRDNPFLAPLVDKRALTQDVSSKLTLHLAFSIAESDIQYEAGDACGIVPQNDPALVDEILGALGFSGVEVVHIPKAGTVELRDAMLHHLAITRLSRKIVEAYAKLGNCDILLGLLLPEQQAHLEKYTYDRGVIDLLEEYPGVIAAPADVVAMLPKLAPRLYSISSSPLAHAGEIHTTAAIVRYRSHNRQRGGVCSTLFADRTPLGGCVPIYIQPNKKFRLPTEPDVPVIMIGPGTGIAPFRAFLHERRALGVSGRNWLFFGERSAATDFLYREELEGMVADGHLTRLDTAFSRDQEHKVYVQDRMLEHAAQFWAWVEEGASIYVCGDASRMAKDVDATLHAIAAKQGGMEAEAATEFVQRLKDEHHYHRDVY